MPRLLILLIPFAAALVTWLSPLAFAPVPWPDDSAFYFVARELFHWPPRWVMLPQAPFEPTYRIFNFNTMPLYPILIGLGRFIGIDGSHALKLWPLAAWAASGSLLVAALIRAGLPLVGAALIALAVALDPTLRWASVIVRPESLIGLAGMAIVLGLTFGFPKRLRARGLWHPVSALLALAAYAHFNAIHLVYAVLAALAFHPREVIAIGWRTALYLAPWALVVLSKWSLFWHQMTLQWKRLAVGNDWLRTPGSAIKSLFQDMGSPEPLPSVIEWAGMGLWLLIGVALIWGLGFGLAAARRKDEKPSLLAASGWVFGAAWLWHTKPEVWFTYYLHLAIWTFAGIALVKLWRSRDRAVAGVLASLIAAVVGIYAYADVDVTVRMSRNVSWHWPTYRAYIDCIDHRLSQLETELGNPKPFRVWAPTFPDVTIELARRHPDWDLTRTNDFYDRADLAIQHGRDVEAVAVSETLGWAERTLSAPQSEHPSIRSTWMNWDAYFLNRLYKDPAWKPNRWLCQEGRWQSFIFMQSPR